MAAHPARRDEKYRLRLYVAGGTPQAAIALRNLKNLCETHLAGRYEIEIIDLAKHPELADANGIVVVPTLTRKMPTPICKCIGILSNYARVLIDFDLRPDNAIAGSAAEAKQYVG